MQFKSFASVVALLTLSFSAHATVVFSDDFEANSVGLNVVPTGWAVSDGTVDIVSPAFHSLCGSANGKCIDLDGSTSNSGVMSKTFALTAGLSYTASFDIAGNGRGAAADSVTIKFGDQSLSLTAIAANAPWATYSLTYVPTVSGVFSLSFENAGGDNIGALLDNVSISAVPEAETYAMLLVGLGLMGMRRQRN